MASAGLLVSLFLLFLVSAAPSLARHRGTRCSVNTCDNVTCAVGRVCEVQSGRAQCVQAMNCDQLRCPQGMECVELPGRTGGVDCRVSCDNINCPLIHECQVKERERGLSSRAECVSPSACPASCPFDAECVERGRGTGSKRSVVCVRNNGSCDGFSCPTGSQCMERERTRGGKLKNARTGTTTDTSTGNRNTRVTVCTPICTNTTCPSGLVCEERESTRRGRYSRVSCRAPRSCAEANCPAGTECRESNCPSPRPRTGTNPRTNTRVSFSCVPVDTTPEPFITPSATPSSSDSSSPAPASSSIAAMSTSISMPTESPVTEGTPTETPVTEGTTPETPVTEGTPPEAK